MVLCGPQLLPRLVDVFLGQHRRVAVRDGPVHPLVPIPQLLDLWYTATYLAGPHVDERLDRRYRRGWCVGHNWQCAAVPRQTSTSAPACHLQHLACAAEGGGVQVQECSTV